MQKIYIILSLSWSTGLIMPMVPKCKSLQQAACVTRRFLSSSQDVQVGATYEHYKGMLYEVMAIARHSEDPALQLVVYRGLYDSSEFGKNPVWVRPYEMFTEKVTINGIVIDRFKKIDTAKKEQ